MKKTIKTIFIVLLFVLVISSLGAEKVKNVTWKWIPDDDVLFFRYQLDNTDNSSWTIVDRSVNEVRTPDLDPYVDHIFYIQLTYDGVNWTDSFYKVSPAIEREEVAPPIVIVPDTKEGTEAVTPTVTIYADNPVETESTTNPEIIVENAGIEEVKAVEEKPVKVKKPLPPYFFSFSVDFGGNMEIRSKNTYGSTAGVLFYPKVSANLDFSFYQAPKNFIGIGLRLDFEDALKPENGDWKLSNKIVQEFSVALDMLISFDFGSLSAYGGVGFGCNFGNIDSGYKTLLGDTFGAAPIIKFILGADYKFGVFLLSLDLDGSLYPFSESIEFIPGAKIGLGFKFSNK